MRPTALLIAAIDPLHGVRLGDGRADFSQTGGEM
jgi:hypothetical protein